MLFRFGIALTLSLVVSAAVASCSATGPGDTGTSSGAGPGGGDAGSDAKVTDSLRIEPATATATALVGMTPPSLSFKAFAKGPDGNEIDVTAQAEWIADPKIASVAGGTAKLTGTGGKGFVSASYQGAEAAAPLTVTLGGEIFLGGASATTKQSFDGAMADPSPANAPTIEYPPSGVVLPANLPPIEAQWSLASDNTAYRVRLAIDSLLDITLYTTARELLFPADAWGVIGASAADAPMSLTVDGLSASGKLIRTSAKTSITIAGDSIEDSAIYVWQSSTGTFRVLDIVKGTDIPFPTDSPALAAGQPCSGCHRISRDGKRFAYTYNGAYFQFGTLVYDAAKSLFTTKIAPTAAVRGTYAAFNPLEATTRPAMLVTHPDNVPQNTMGTVRLDVVDPDTNAAIPSNLAATITSIDPAVGHATSMPDWSPAGDFVVFSAYNSDLHHVRLLGDDMVLSSIVEAPVTYSAATMSFTFGAPKVLVKTPATNPDTGENNILPTISPDGKAVAFTPHRGVVVTQDTAIVVQRDGRGRPRAAERWNRVRARRRSRREGNPLGQHVAAVGTDDRAALSVAGVRVRATVWPQAHVIEPGRTASAALSRGRSSASTSGSWRSIGRSSRRVWRIRAPRRSSFRARRSRRSM